jgi:S1-C subfamily serine protease
MNGMRKLTRDHRWERGRWRAGGTGTLLLSILLLSALPFATTAQAASFASGGICATAKRGVDLALPAVVRISTIYQAQVVYTTSDGSGVTFPQNGSTYTLTISGTGAFVSGDGDVLTAYSVVNAPQETLNLMLAQQAAPDIAQALNDSNSGSTVTAASILNQLLTDPQSWQPTIQQPQSFLYMSSQYSGPTDASSLESVQRYPVTITAQSSPDQQVYNDLAILHVGGLRDLPTIPLGDSNQVYQDDPLTIISFPSSADLASSDGLVVPDNFITASVKTVTVSALKTAADTSQLIQIDGSMEQGEGGGPALNADGQLVGVVSLVAGTGSGQVSFLHTANDAKALAQQAKVSLAQDGFDKRWAAAYDACASSASGHWHDAYSQYTQLARLYPNFKGVQPYATYTRAQAAHEPATGLSLPAWAIALIVALLLASAAGVFLLYRRRGLRRSTSYVGYGPGLNKGAYGPAGYSLGAPAPSAQPSTPLVASEQIGVTVPTGGDFSSTQIETPAGSDILPD